MRVPSKVTPFKESSFALFPIILSKLEKERMKPEDLYNSLKRNNKIKNVGEMVELIDCLYAMNKIDMDEEEIWYVG